VLYRGKVIEPFFYKQADNAVRVEDEVAALGVSVTYNAVKASAP
jgi:hypothetical protein